MWMCLLCRGAVGNITLALIIQLIAWVPGILVNVVVVCIWGCSVIIPCARTSACMHAPYAVYTLYYICVYGGIEAYR